VIRCPNCRGDTTIRSLPAHGAARTPLASTLACPRCNRPLVFAHDLQRSVMRLAKAGFPVPAGAGATMPTPCVPDDMAAS